jgi:hypothetical protein
MKQTVVLHCLADFSDLAKWARYIRIWENLWVKIPMTEVRRKRALPLHERVRRNTLLYQHNMATARYRGQQ